MEPSASPREARRFPFRSIVCCRDLAEQGNQLAGPETKLFIIEETLRRVI
jgi:hypothetical protein